MNIKYDEEGNPLTQELVRADQYTPEAKQRMWNDMEKFEPVLWRKCYPKIYEPYKPAEYCSPKEPARQMFSIAKKIEMGYVGDAEKYEIFWASRMAQYRSPIYWLSKDIVEAVMQTAPPIELDWYNMPLPFSAMTFLIPKGTSITHAEEGETKFVGFSRQRIQEDVPSLAAGGPKTWASLNGAMTLVAKTEPYFHHWNIPYSDIKTVNLAEIDGMALRFNENPHSSGWLSSPEFTPEDVAFGAKVAHLVFGTLLLMEARPDLVTRASLVKKVKPAKASEQPKEFWSPAVIGANYRIRKEQSQSLGGSHASPRGHWVRGYYREQPHGPKMSLRKRLWIEPFWRGGDAA